MPFPAARCTRTFHDAFGDDFRNDPEHPEPLGLELTMGTEVSVQKILYNLSRKFTGVFKILLAAITKYI